MLSRHRWWLWALVALLACRGARAEEAVAEQAATGHKFLRLTRDDDGNPVSMDTSVVSYQPAAGQPAGLVVDLIGAVHIGERPYYEELNKLFADYDVVLYELVAPKGTRVPKGGRGRDAHPVSMLQSGMKDMLGLESQVELIDYQKENLVHADMSPEDFAESMEKKGDNFFVLFFRMMGRSLAQQSKQQVLARDGKAHRTNDADMLLALFDPNRSHKLKQIMAEQFEGMDGMMEAIEGPDGSTIISERNKVALAGLKEQIAAGKKRIGIFYGAGHMPDMEQRLIEEFGLQRGDERWLTAWQLNEQPAAEKSEK